MLVGLTLLGALNPPTPPQFGIGFKWRGRFRQDFPESVFTIRGGGGGYLLKGGSDYLGD